MALPHLTGEKWGIIDRDVMLVQRCGSCNYGGPAQFNVYNASAIWQQGDWWFAAAGDAGGGGTVGWAAMRPAWGGCNFTNATSAAAKLLSAAIFLRDTWSPLVIVAGSAAEYGTVTNFSAQIASATVSTDATHSHVGLEWKGRVFGFTPGPGTWKGEWTLPTLDGKPVDVDPPFVYSSPHLNAAVGSEVVTASYGTTYTLKYNFGDDTITRA